MCVDGSQKRRCLTDKQGDGDDIYRLFNEAEYDMKNYTARRTRRSVAITHSKFSKHQYLLVDIFQNIWPVSRHSSPLTRILRAGP